MPSEGSPRGDARLRLVQSYPYAEKHVGLDASKFRSEMKLGAFLDWLSNCDTYFNWFQLLEQQEVQFATAKLKGATTFCGYDRGTQPSGQDITSWPEMKTMLKQKFLPIDYDWILN